MSENLQSAIQSALEAKPTEFKDAIYNEIGLKVQDVLQMKKMEIANVIFNPEQEQESEEDSDFKSEEDNVDEDL